MSHVIKSDIQVLSQLQIRLTESTKVLFQLLW